MRANQKRAGFSLVELVVVTAIITVAAAVMIPVDRTKREIAQNIICKSNIKDIGLAGHLWSIDNDGWVLPGLWDRGNGDDPLIKPYLGDPEAGLGVMLCPSVPAMYAGKTFGELGLTQDVAGLANAGHYYNSYGYNLTLCNMTSKPLGMYDDANHNGTQWGNVNVWYYAHGNTRLATVQNPAEKVFFAESILYVSYPSFYNKAMFNPAFRDPAARGRRHFARRRTIIGTPDTEMCGVMNIAWIDGSASQEPDEIERVRPAGKGYEIVSSYWYGD